MPKVTLKKVAIDITLVRSGPMISEAAEMLLHAWRKSDEGKWCTENCVGITVRNDRDPAAGVHRFIFVGELTDQQYTYYTLKWGNKVNILDE